MNQATLRRVRQTALLTVALLGFPVSALADDKPSAEGVEFFERKVRPLLVKHCYSCHSAEAEKLRGELRLDTRDGVRAGGASGPGNQGSASAAQGDRAGRSAERSCGGQASGSARGALLRSGL